MPSVALCNLSESIFNYWIKLSLLVREMITLTPKPTLPTMINGSPVTAALDTECKYLRLKAHGFDTVIFLFSV